jgi:hypothetical protein
MRVQHQLHFENVACDVMCEHNCTLQECMNRVRTNLVGGVKRVFITNVKGTFLGMSEWLEGHPVS